MTLTSTFRSRVKRAAVTSLAGTILLGGVGLGVQQASATTSGSPVVFANENDQNGERTAGDISATDWEAIARQAEAAGDREGAQAARKVAQRGGVAGNGQESIFTIAKKLAKVALKHGRIFLPKTIRSWADKIYGLIDSIEATTELGIATFLVQNGIPADVAIEIARWIVTFA